MNNNKKILLAMKQACTDAKIGTEIICPSCNTKHIKKSYQSAFCGTKGGTKCKDNFWNNVTPTKRNNKTRISPANARYMNNVILPNEALKRGFPNVETMRNYVDEDYGEGCTVLPCEWCGLRSEYCRCD